MAIRYYSPEEEVTTPAVIEIKPPTTTMVGKSGRVFFKWQGKVYSYPADWDGKSAGWIHTSNGGICECKPPARTVECPSAVRITEEEAIQLCGGGPLTSATITTTKEIL